MKTPFYVTISLLLVCTLAPVSFAGEKRIQTNTITKHSSEPNNEKNTAKTVEPVKRAKPATPDKPEAAKVGASKPGKVDIAKPSGQQVPKAQDTTVAPVTVDTRTPELLGLDGTADMPGRLDFPDPGVDDGLGAADPAAASLFSDGMDAIVINPGSSGDEPGIGDNDPDKDTGIGGELDMTNTTGAIDPVETGGLDPVSGGDPGTDDVVTCARGECEDGKVVATTAPASARGDTIDPQQGWTDPPPDSPTAGDGPPLGDGDNGPGRNDIDPCTLDATCERTGMTPGEEATYWKDCEETGDCQTTEPETWWPQKDDGGEDGRWQGPVVEQSMGDDPDGHDQTETQDTDDANDSSDPPYEGPAPAD